MEIEDSSAAPRVLAVPMSTFPRFREYPACIQSHDLVQMETFWLAAQQIPLLIPRPHFLVSK
jgi:hypothetical protein